ncbi:hypothetical protein WHR41_03244 [Cladosporium halotolerans]|uniref:Exocyst complex component EXO84 n=1 Tax=Cladosporium halotolerans TaxID=1052096 RepID=A0AB34KVS9_9PEZI
MSEDKKGLSLRRKKTSTRPTISAPRQIQPRDRSADSRWDGPAAGAPGNNKLEAPRAREARPSISGSTGGDTTSDLVKRRYSTRFAALPQDATAGLVPPVPTIPNIPAQYARDQGRGASKSPSRDGRSQSRGPGPLKVDPRALADPKLQAEKYVQSILAEASESDIQGYQNDLQNLKAHTSADLQHNVYQNRTQFIRISKEADKLKSEMRTLRTLMSELTGTLGHATNAGGAELNGSNGMSLADRKRANRSSVANLEAMWTTHLQTLWKRVEGSQKHLPALPGRHIIMESQRWVELNAATWKPRRRVVLVLLNDHLLIASEKKRNDILAGQGPNSNPKNNRQSMYNPQSQTILVTDRCWNLQDVSLADLSGTQAQAVGRQKENDAVRNAVNIRAGNESFTYATSDAAEKAGMLIAFRKAQEDLRKQIAREHGERERAVDELAMLTGKDPRSLKKAAAAALERSENQDAKLGGLSRSNSILVDAEGRQQSIRHVESQIDGLDIDIALQRFEEAVSKVEKLRKLGRSIKGNAIAQDIIMSKVNERASRLASSIARQLSQTSGGAEKTRENVHWLLRLGFEELARSRYLEARTETLRLRTRQLPFRGALPPYLHALSFVTFSMLVHTFRTFSTSFPSSSGSAVVKWAKERVDEFNASLQRQLSSVEWGSELWEDCVSVVREQAQVLGEVGVDFKGLVAQGLDEVAKATRKEGRERVRRSMGGAGLAGGLTSTGA